METPRRGQINFASPRLVIIRLPAQRYKASCEHLLLYRITARGLHECTNSDENCNGRYLTDYDTTILYRTNQTSLDIALRGVSSKCI